MLNQYEDHFPLFQLTPLLYAAIDEACMISCAPVALVAGVAFGAAALACQGHVRVKSPIGKLLPLSLFMLSIAKSGERKTSVEELFGRGVREFQTFHEKCWQEQVSEHEQSMCIWLAEKKALDRKLEATLLRDEGIAQIKELLAAHASRRPTPRHRPKIFYSETTTGALFRNLSKRWPSAVLQSSEAATILLGSAAQNLGALNILWDVGEFEVDRLNEGSFVVRGASLSASLMLQPGAMQKFLARHAGNARDIGLLARFLICYPTSTQGMRFLTSAAPSPTPSLDKFSEVSRNLLRESLSDDGVLCEKLTVLEFQQDAADEWRNFYNYVETDLAPGGLFSDIPDFASKISENVVRLAAIFHTVERKPGQYIDRQTTLSAIHVGAWYLREFKRLLGDPQHLSEEILGARVLENWLRVQCSKQPGRDRFPAAYIRSFGPNKLRNKKQLDAAFDQLISESKIQIWQEKKQRLVFLNPYHFGQNFPQQQYAAIPYTRHL